MFLRAIVSCFYAWFYYYSLTYTIIPYLLNPVIQLINPYTAVGLNMCIIKKNIFCVIIYVSYLKYFFFVFYIIKIVKKQKKRSILGL